MTASTDSPKKFPLPSVGEEELEQSLAMVWNLLEAGHSARAELEKALDTEIRSGMLSDLYQRGFLHSHQEMMIFSAEGKRLAQSIVRRHRLAERLLQDVLTVAEDQIDSNACRLEHVISAGVEEAICTLLGHPQVCPHGAPIPRGSCCDRALTETKPIVFPLTGLKNGDRGHIAYLSPGNRPELHKFIAMGLVPGADIRLAQTSPALVIEIGDTIIAMDADLARNIFVRKIATPA
jgi:DtxR family transcriptional regulator, Mn-dependent transcriptional regulator